MYRLPIIIAALFLVLACQGVCFAVFSVGALNVASTEDFTGFTGSGFDAPPAAGQLDSDTWRVEGMSSGGGTFGGTHTTASTDFTRGSSSGGETTGGVYAFDVGGGNTIFGFQPTEGDLTPGEVTLKVQNNTGHTVDTWNLAYSIFTFNDKTRSNSFNLSFSTDDSTYTSVAALDFATPESADASPSWSESTRSTALSVSVLDSGSLYLKWSLADVSGGGSRDEYGLDNLSITAVPEPTAFLYGGLVCAFVGLAHVRRKVARCAATKCDI